MAELTHFDDDGAARMVEVGEKAETTREAVASGAVEMAAETLARVKAGSMAKGDVLGVARIAAIQGMKRTAELIPLCHPLPLTHVNVELTPVRRGYRIEARVRTSSQTGVEMEALTAVAVAALTIYDMVKAVDKEMVIGDVCLVEKKGGRSGHYVRNSKLKTQNSKLLK